MDDQGDQPIQPPSPPRPSSSAASIIINRRGLSTIEGEGERESSPTNIGRKARPTSLPRFPVGRPLSDDRLGGTPLLASVPPFRQANASAGGSTGGGDARGRGSLNALALEHPQLLRPSSRGVGGGHLMHHAVSIGQSDLQQQHHHQQQPMSLGGGGSTGVSFHTRFPSSSGAASVLSETDPPFLSRTTTTATLTREPTFRLPSRGDDSPTSIVTKPSSAASKRNVVFRSGTPPPALPSHRGTDFLASKRPSAEFQQLPAPLTKKASIYFRQGGPPNTMNTLGGGGGGGKKSMRRASVNSNGSGGLSSRRRASIGHSQKKVTISTEGASGATGIGSAGAIISTGTGTAAVTAAAHDGHDATSTAAATNTRNSSKNQTSNGLLKLGSLVDVTVESFDDSEIGDKDQSSSLSWWRSGEENNDSKRHIGTRSRRLSEKGDRDRGDPLSPPPSSSASTPPATGSSFLQSLIGSVSSARGLLSSGQHHHRKGKTGANKRLSSSHHVKRRGVFSFNERWSLPWSRKPSKVRSRGGSIDDGHGHGGSLSDLDASHDHSHDIESTASHEGGGGEEEGGGVVEEEDEEEEEEGVLADEIVNNIEHAKKAMAYQAEFVKTFAMSQSSSQFIHFLQVNATIWSIHIAWPPAIRRLLKLLEAMFIFNFEIFKFHYTALVVCSIFPFICYYLSEVFWKNSARWRHSYITDWAHERTKVWRVCTLVIISTGLICAGLVAYGSLTAVDTFAIIWAVALTSILLYLAFVGLGDLMRKFYIILESDEERMTFFLQIRYWMRYLVLLALNFGYLPILAKLFKIIYKAKKYHHKGLEVETGPWVTAVILAALYGIGFPAVLYFSIGQRRSLYTWVSPDPTLDGKKVEGHYEPKNKQGAIIKHHHHKMDDDGSVYNFLQLEQQVYNLSLYQRHMPLITDMDKREDVVRRVQSSLCKKTLSAKMSRRRSEELFALEHGHPVDDYWKPLKQNYFWWKILVYYIERGFLVGLVVTQDGQKVAKSIDTIIASFVAIGSTALMLQMCRPYLKDKENWLESFFDACSSFNICIALCLYDIQSTYLPIQLPIHLFTYVKQDKENWLEVFFDACSTFNICIALCLYEKWLDTSTQEAFVTYLLLVPNLLVLAVAIYIMDPRAIFRALRFKYAQFQEKTREHILREKELANRESRALFEAAFKGDVQRVRDLLAQGRADVRYRKPKDVKPAGFADYTPTQVAVYMGKHECLELLLQHHTLFAEEDIVNSRLQRHFRLLHYIILPILTAASYLSPSAILAWVHRQRRGYLRRDPNNTTNSKVMWAADRNKSLSKQASLRECVDSTAVSAAGGTDAGALAIIIPPPLTTSQHHPPPQHRSPLRQSQANIISHVYPPTTTAASKVGTLKRPATKWGRFDSMTMEPEGALKCLQNRNDHDEISTLVGLAFVSWSRDCLDLLITYGSEVTFKFFPPGAENNAAAASVMSPSSSSTTQHNNFNLMSTLLDRLYHEASSSPMDVKLRNTAAAALHHPRDLQWILDPYRGNVMEDRDGPMAFVRKVFRKIKTDQKSTKDMKVMAMKALVDEVVQKRVCGGATLTLDFSSFGIDDQYLDHILHNMWDFTATKLPTNLLLEGNAITDFGIRSLVLRMRENMSNGGGAAGAVAGLGLGGIGSTANVLIAAAPGERGPLNHNNRQGSVQQNLSTSGLAFALGGQSITSLNLSGNFIGTDAALFLADLIVDYPTSICSVTVYKTECSIQSPTSLAFDRVADRSLSIENALVVGLIADAYVGLKRFIFTLRDADRLLPDAFVRLTQLTELDLRGNLLEGPLPTSLLLIAKKNFGHNRLTLPCEGLHELEHTTTLDCSSMGLTGGIPISWGATNALPSLKSLSFAQNASLEGPIPAGLLVRSQAISMSFTGCRLSLPSDITPFLEASRTLTALDLRDQGLTGSIPSSWTSLIFLQSLNLSNNALFGEIPASLLALKHRDFSHNVGLCLPASVDILSTTLGHLSQLDLSNQGLKGTLPEALSLLTSLQMLDVSGNHLEGPIPAALLLIPKRRFGRNRLELPKARVMEVLGTITSLDLNSQDLCGSIPASWACLTALSSLDLSANRLKGPLPARLLAIERKHLKGNALTLPEEGVNEALAGLTCLDLKDQGFVGNLPEALVRLPGLRRLDLSGANYLEGRLPMACIELTQESCFFLNDKQHHAAEGNSSNDSICSSSSYQPLEILLGGGHNQLSLPDEELRGPTLKRLTIANSGLVGGLTRGLSRLVALERIELSHNRLDGDVIDALSPLINLEVLDLSYNKFHGSLHSWISALEHLRVLDFGHNQLRGILPEAVFSVCHNLEIFRANDNAIEGSLPESLGKLINLTEVDVARNKLVGGIPNSLHNLTKLRVLDLSRQQRLQGIIPECFSCLTSLEIVRLDFNHLIGHVPEGLCALPSLRILTLRQNSVIGCLPAAASKLVSLEVLDLGGNRMSGNWVEHFPALPNLNTLFLDSLGLEGEIPESLKHLHSLTALNLSNNKLAGHVPEWLVDLKGLKKLNVATNRLMGDLPASLIVDKYEELKLYGNKFEKVVPFK